jgi:hypothetical protein
MDLPCNMAVYAPSISIFFFSQFPTAPPYLLAPTFVYRLSLGFISSMTSVPLAAEMKLPAKKSPTRFANKSHLIHIARQLWKEDCFEYQKLTNVQNAVTGSEE